jgi:hypothetical protein
MRKYSVALVLPFLTLFGWSSGFAQHATVLTPSVPTTHGATSGVREQDEKGHLFANVDLLLEYAEKPDGLIFIDSVAGDGQVIATARYRVPGVHAEMVERFFVEKYGMGPLVFLCCAWEPERGRSGQLESEPLLEIEPGYVLLITMFADAVIESADGELYLEMERENIEHFHVIVSIVWP